MTANLRHVIPATRSDRNNAPPSEQQYSYLYDQVPNELQDGAPFGATERLAGLRQGRTESGRLAFLSWGTCLRGHADGRLATEKNRKQGGQENVMVASARRLATPSPPAVALPQFVGAGGGCGSMAPPNYTTAVPRRCVCMASRLN